MISSANLCAVVRAASLVAVQGVVVSNELAGVIDKIGFESGQVVDKGALLVELNTGTEEAQLRSLQAAAELARQNLERAKKLRESNVNAQSDLDTAQAQYEQSLANSENVRALIDSVVKAKPSGAKGTYLKKISLSSTMGPGVKVSLGSVGQAEAHS